MSSLEFNDMRTGALFSLRTVDSSGGQQLDLSSRFLGFTYKESDSKADEFELTLENSDLALFDFPAFFHGQKVDVCWGYKGNMVAPRRCVLSKPNGWSTYTLSGRVEKDKAMDNVPATRRFENVRYSDVAAQVANDAGIPSDMVQIDETKPVVRSVQQGGNETDARFLARLARKIGYVFFVDHTGLHFHKRRVKNPATRHYSYGFEVYGSHPGGDVIGEPSFEMAHLRRKPAAVNVTGVNSETGEAYKEKGSNKTAFRETLGMFVSTEDPEELVSSEDNPAGFVSEAEVLYTPAPTREEAAELASGQFAKAASENQKLTLSVVGDPAVEKGQVVGFWCKSKFVSGHWYVKECTHSVSGSGYTQDLTLIRDASESDPLSEVRPELRAEMNSPIGQSGGRAASYNEETGENDDREAEQTGLSGVAVDEGVAELNEGVADTSGLVDKRREGDFLEMDITLSDGKPGKAIKFWR